MVGLIAVLVLLAVTAPPVVAQPRIFVVIDAPGGATNTLWEAAIDVDRLSAVQARVTVPGNGSSPIVAAGGQFVLWQIVQSSGALDIAFDRRSGATGVVPGTCTGVPDPSRARLFTCLAGAIGIVSPSGVSTLPGTDGLQPRAMSDDGTRVYASRVLDPGPPVQHELVAIDASSGTRLGAIPIGVAPASVTPAEDKESVWVISARPTAPERPLLRRFDWPSGDERVTVALAVGSPPLSWFTHRIAGVDSARNRLVLATTQGFYRVQDGVSTGFHLFDMESGTTLGAVVSVAGWGPASLDRGSGDVLAISQSTMAIPLDPAPWLVRASLDDGRELSRFRLDTTRFLRAVSFGTPPRPPVLAAPVESPPRTVSFAWTPSTDLTRGFTVEAGSAPGLANLAVLPVLAGTRLTVPGVPPGTYYVRVRAWNDIGASVPSNEIVVSVP